MTMKVYFPTGIVTGQAFCNREHERDYLKRRLDQNTHIVLMSPRRYGKSSLIAQFTEDQKIPFCSIDLLPATSDKYVKNAVVDGVTQLLGEMMPASKKAKQKLLGYFSRMNPAIELSAFGQKIKLNPDEKTPEETIMKLLMSLDNAAIEMNKKLIFVMDEFQQIATLEHAHSLEASIRHAVERSQNVFYVFSGSNRTLLEDMFQNKDRPLYHLCDEVKLNRIKPDCYLPFIKKAADSRWKLPISEMSLSKILDLTECHPYYVNRLCRMLWDQTKPPTPEGVEMTWHDYTRTQKTDWVSDMLSKLTVNQRAVLAGLAKSPEKEVRGKDFSVRLNISSSSIQRTMASLISQDLVYKSEDNYHHVLNPVVKIILSENKYFD
ncbi:MAG: ATP-binding protein [Legionellaceae bacterium]|nr:ATP-binding protein [Legionellaceae bacterium]